jgi:hypothetical protein
MQGLAGRSNGLRLARMVGHDYVRKGATEDEWSDLDGRLRRVVVSMAFAWRICRVRHPDGGGLTAEGSGPA